MMSMHKNRDGFIYHFFESHTVHFIVRTPYKFTTHRRPILRLPPRAIYSKAVKRCYVQNTCTLYMTLRDNMIVFIR